MSKKQFVLVLELYCIKSYNIPEDYFSMEKKYMQVTFLVGNGFDLNLGLKTNYSDFLDEYQKPKDTDSELIKKFKKDILEDQKLWASAEYAFGQYTKKFKEEGYNAAEFITCYIDFCAALGSYLLEQEQALNYSELKTTLINGFADSIKNFLLGHKDSQKQIIQNSYSAVSGGISYRFLCFNYTATLDLMIDFASKSPGVLGNRVVRGLTTANDIKPAIHVHGYTDRDMVLGVNDISQIADTTLFDEFSPAYINQLIKIKANEMNEGNTDQRAEALLKNSDLIYVYGMSFGDTDALWWKRICEVMKARQSVHLLLHCHDVPTDERLAITYQLYAAQKKQEFLRHCQYDNSTKENLAQRIHISRSNLFQPIKNVAIKTPVLSR